MGRWRWWQVGIACVGHVVAVVAVTLWRLTARAESEMRRAGLPTDDLYVLFPLPAAWWVALVVLPPALLVAAWLWRRRGP
jgi:hypothetical protein